MADKTKQELAESVARRLGLIAANEPLSSHDSEYIEEEYDILLERWRDQGKAYWPNTSRSTAEIPLGAYDAVVNLLASHVAPAFSLPEPVVSDEAAGQVPAGVKGWKDLVRHVARKSTRLPVRADYY